MISLTLLLACPSVGPLPNPPAGTTDTGNGTPDTGDSGAPGFVPDPDWVPLDGITWTGDPGDLLGAEFTVGDADGDGDAEIVATRLTLLTGPTEYRSAETHGALLIEGVPAGGPARDMARAEWVEAAVDHGSFGRWATVVGDVSGDGTPDVAMSGLHAEAMVLVYSGEAAGDFGIVDANLVVSKANDDGDYEWSHAPIAPCGDVSGDGLDDLCAGDRVFWGPVPATVDESDADLAFLSPGRPEGYVLQDVEPVDMDADGVNEVVLAMFSVEEIGDSPRLGRFDASTAGERDVTQPDTRWDADGLGSLDHGDLDGDGVDDLLVHPGASPGQPTFVFTDTMGGAVTDAPVRLSARHDHAFGTRLAVGDFDGDGQQDLAGSATNTMPEGERVVVFSGPVSPGDWSEDDATAIWLLPSSNNPLAALGAGDIDADGRADLVIGRTGDESGGPGAGALTFLSGAGL
ncbi:MAG: hypothetical protein ABMA64_19675 [Myxococcota bacterium]